MIAANGAIPIPAALSNAAVAVVMRWMLIALVMIAVVVIIVVVIMMMVRVCAGTTYRSVSNMQYMRLSFQIVCDCVLL